MRQNTAALKPQKQLPSKTELIYVENRSRGVRRKCAVCGNVIFTRDLTCFKCGGK